MDNTAKQFDAQDLSSLILPLKVVEQPLYLVGTQVVSLGRENSWEAFKDDLSALYTCNSRWLGGRFVAWTLEILTPNGLREKRGGYFDTETGTYYFGKSEFYRTLGT